MNRPTTPLPRGTEILTHATLGDTEGMLVSPMDLLRRRTLARGVIAGGVAGHLGAVYWIEHGDPKARRPDRAPYHVSEIELVAQPGLTTTIGRLRARRNARAPEQVGIPTEQVGIPTALEYLRLHIERSAAAALRSNPQGKAAR